MQNSHRPSLCRLPSSPGVQGFRSQWPREFKSDVFALPLGMWVPELIFWIGVWAREKPKLFLTDLFDLEVTLEHTIQIYDLLEDGWHMLS